MNIRRDVSCHFMVSLSALKLCRKCFDNVRSLTNSARFRQAHGAGFKSDSFSRDGSL